MPGEGYDPYLEADTDALITQAVNLSIAVNHVNRALDLPDLYPFVLTQPVREKMALAHPLAAAPLKRRLSCPAARRCARRGGRSRRPVPLRGAQGG